MAMRMKKHDPHQIYELLLVQQVPLVITRCAQGTAQRICIRMIGHNGLNQDRKIEPRVCIIFLLFQYTVPTWLKQSSAGCEIHFG